MATLRVLLSENNPITHDLSDEVITVGRISENSLQIEDDSISSRHAKIEVSGGTIKLTDLDSTNGTFVNGQPVTEVVLKPGDLIRFGNVDTEFQSDAAAHGAERQPLPQTEAASHSAASDSSRPPSFVNASPFPKPPEKKDVFAMIAVLIAVLGSLAFAGAVAMSVMLELPPMP